ncbi:lysosome-associated membrane glycoprotein 3 isoform X2 [Antechinus flavipes]|uniref:lysosome-associated membrane glycoprotein 3 isoform X2 n=1 Tax=Antechinus flavipes TaxID=38775 RepID=UPI002235558D|nr:lysosome-associated membrane glycoprotein 3 isoform X2 [Antechinus flavipes]
MKKALAVLIVFTFSAAILSYYSDIINWKLVDVRGFLRTSVPVTTETSLINPTSHAPHDPLQTGSAEGHTSASRWQTPQESLKTVSTGASTRPAGPATLPDVTTEVPQNRTHTRAPEGTDTLAPAGSPTAPSPGWSSPSVTQRTTAPQTATSVNPGSSSAPGSPTASSPGWSSPSITQRTTAPQTATSVNPGSSSAPGSPTASSPGWSSPSITQRTTAPQTATSVNPGSSSAPGSPTASSPGWSSPSITQRTTAPQTTTTMNPGTSSAPGSPTASSPGWSSPSITQRTTAPQTATSMNPGTSAPGSPTASSPGWSSPSVTQSTMTSQSIADPTTLRITTQTTPSSKQTSLTTSGSATSAKGKTTRALPTAVTHHVTATTASTKTTVGPTLAPQPSAPQTGNYLVYNGSRACLRADMGVQLLIQDKKTYFTSQMYFNLDPNVTQASGNCGPQRSNLLLTFPGGFVNLTFVKVKQSYHIETVEASLTISSSMNIYSGLKDGLTMFETKVGYSFKCVSEQSVNLSSSLQLHTIDVRLQAFDFDGEHFGNVNECTSDYAIMVPVIILIVIPLCIVILVFCGIRLRKKSMGYQRI